MKKMLCVLGALTLVILVAAGIGAAVLVYEGKALDGESKAFVDSAVPAIAARWDQQQLLDRATPDLKRSISQDRLTSMFKGLSQLGPLVNYEGATGEANMLYFTGTGASVSASYVAKADFQNGNAVFQIALVKREGHWMINGFHVDPRSGSRAREGA
jgi:hypothetical protein